MSDTPPSKHLILATAGHIDHGKTELTRALTGVDTDRLKEEKERGITIDLGFAHAELGDGRRLAVIDVPGHERFVKNMLAGVAGVDLALLVVASDESVMPQTREHMDILKLLGVRRGVVALTKADLVDEETLELARLELSEFVENTFLENAPLVTVSARTGQGLDELRQALIEAFDSVEARSHSGPFRLHVDRAFTVRGFGAVVTGTVVSGALSEGDEVEILPDGRRAKVRSLEVHGSRSDRVRAGNRAALNLSGVEHDQLRRGQQIVSPTGLYRASALLDVELSLLPSSPRLRNLSRVRFHLGAEEALARLKLVGRLDPVEPGQKAWVQVRLERPLVAWPGDRFIIRRYAPITTIGGGMVIDNIPSKHRGQAVAMAAWLEGLVAAGPADRISLLASSLRRGALSFEELVARSGELPERVRERIRQVAQSQDVVLVGSEQAPSVVARSRWDALRKRVLELLRVFHQKEPLREGLSREELKERLLYWARSGPVVRALLDEMARDGELVLKGEVAALASHKVNLSEEESRLKQEIETRYRDQALNPPTAKELNDGWPGRGELVSKLLRLLEREQRLVAVGQGLYFHAEALERLDELLAPHVGTEQPLSVPRFKDLTGTSRKHAIPLLEYLDRLHVTRRVGDARVVQRLRKRS